MSKRQPFLPYTQSSCSSSSFEASKPQGLTAKPTLLFPFFLLFFLQVAIERGGKGVKKTSVITRRSRRRKQGLPLPRNYPSIHLTRPETLVPRKGVISPLEPDLDSSPLASALSFMARLPVTGFRPGFCVMPCFRQFQLCLRNTRITSSSPYS